MDVDPLPRARDVLVYLLPSLATLTGGSGGNSVVNTRLLVMMLEVEIKCISKTERCDGDRADRSRTGPAWPQQCGLGGAAAIPQQTFRPCWASSGSFLDIVNCWSAGHLLEPPVCLPHHVLARVICQSSRQVAGRRRRHQPSASLQC